jgi:hypothetical protein
MIRGAMRRSAFAILLLLALPSVASAKGPDTATVCGASSCVTTTDVDRVNAIALYGGFAMRGAPKQAPFFTIDLTSSRITGVDWSLVYVPSARAVRVIRADFALPIYRQQRSTPYWVTPVSKTLATLERTTAGLEPYRPSARWEPPSGSGNGRWFAVAGGAAAAVALAGALVLLRTRRRASTQPAPASPVSSGG